MSKSTRPKVLSKRPMIGQMTETREYAAVEISYDGEVGSDSARADNLLFAEVLKHACSYAKRANQRIDKITVDVTNYGTVMAKFIFVFEG